MPKLKLDTSTHPLCFASCAGVPEPPLTPLEALALNVFVGRVLADLVARDFPVFVVLPVFLVFTAPPFFSS